MLLPKINKADPDLDSLSLLMNLLNKEAVLNLNQKNPTQVQVQFHQEVSQEGEDLQQETQIQLKLTMLEMKSKNQI